MDGASAAPIWTRATAERHRSRTVAARSRIDLGQLTTTFERPAACRISTIRLRNVTRTGPYVRASISHTAAASRASGASYDAAFVPSLGFGGSTRASRRAATIRCRSIATASTCRARRLAADRLRSSRPRCGSTRSASRTAGYALARSIRLRGLLRLHAQDTIVAGGEVNRNRVGVAVRRLSTHEDSLMEATVVSPARLPGGGQPPQVVVHRPGGRCASSAGVALAVFWPKKYLSKAAIGVPSPTLSAGAAARRELAGPGRAAARDLSSCCSARRCSSG